MSGGLGGSSFLGCSRAANAHEDVRYGAAHSPFPGAAGLPVGPRLLPWSSLVVIRDALVLLLLRHVVQVLLLPWSHLHCSLLLEVFDVLSFSSSVMFHLSDNLTFSIKFPE